MHEEIKNLRTYYSKQCDQLEQRSKEIETLSEGLRLTQDERDELSKNFKV